MAQAQGLDKLIKAWLTQEGLIEEALDLEGYNFHYKLTYHNRIYRCLQPEDSPDKAVLVTTVRLSPDHLTALSAMEGADLEEFYWQLRFEFLHKVAFALKMNEAGLLQEFQLSKTLYADGLTKDRFMRDLRTLHDANLAGIWTVQRRFGPGGDTWGAEGGSGSGSGGSGRGEELRPEMYL